MEKGAGDFLPICSHAPRKVNRSHPCYQKNYLRPRIAANYFDLKNVVLAIGTFLTTLIIMIMLWQPEGCISTRPFDRKVVAPRKKPFCFLHDKIATPDFEN